MGTLAEAAGTRKGIKVRPKQKITAGWADAARSSFNEIGRIAYWFSTKTELNITMAEIVQIGQINIPELAKAIGLK